LKEDEILFWAQGVLQYFFDPKLFRSVLKMMVLRRRFRMSAKTTGYVLIAVSLMGIGFTLFRNGDMLWFNDPSSLITLIICMLVLTIGVRFVKK